MADPSRKRIIPGAITGAIHTPTMSDALPYTADDIAEQAVAAGRSTPTISRPLCPGSNRRPVPW